MAKRTYKNKITAIRHGGEYDGQRVEVSKTNAQDLTKVLRREQGYNRSWLSDFRIESI